MTTPLPVYRVAHLSLSLACVRLGLGAIGFAAALLAGAESRAGAVALGLGLGGSLVALVSSQRWALVERPEVTPLPADAEHSGALLPALGRALMPSTAGVTGLLAISLAFEPVLAALLAGVLAGMGALALAVCVDVVLRERRSNVRFYGDAARRRFAGPR